MKLHWKWGASLLAVSEMLVGIAAGEDLGYENPYYSGCLQAKLEDWNHQLRTCNSDDPLEAIGVLCQPPKFDNYLEIRTQVRDWDSILVLSWLTQIILSELLGVPTTIEAGPELSQELNFYAPTSPETLQYSSERDWEVVGTPLELPNGDCRYANRNDPLQYQYCAHWIPEGWDFDGDWMTQMIIEGKAEPSQGMGLLGKNTWFVTKFTAEADPTLDSYHGLVGESNRRKLAETFLRPTTWQQYCKEVSTSNCTQPDQVAQRSPQDDEEAQRMFYPGQFTGHFRKTPQNDCDANNTTCTGHIGNFPCSWQSRMSATLYHLGIALSNVDGPNDYGSYTVQQQIDMWDAANATRSNLIMLWWTPEPLYYRYLGTDAEMQRIQLTTATSECMEGRWESTEECSDDLMTRVGSTTPQGVCEEPPRLLQKVVSGNLLEVTRQYEDAIQSPAYNMLRRFKFSEHQLGEIFQLWESEATPRDAICTWAANNVEFLKGFVPSTYPRVAREEQENVFSYVLIALTSVATILVLIFSWLVHVHRDRPSLQYAQMGFLRLLLAGALLVGVGSILNTIPASNASCVATVWFVNIGYTLELVPLIVKVAAINQMMAAAKKMTRVTLTRQQLYRAVVVILALCTIFLAVWSGLDPPQKTLEYSLTKETTENGETVVGVQYYCQSEKLVWEYVAVGWNTVLLMCAAVLAFQTRNTLKAFNESGNLAILITSHFFFVLLRCGTFLMSDIWKDTMMIQVRSLLYACDTVATLLIYFLPKLLAKNSSEPLQPRISGINLESQSSSIRRTNADESITRNSERGVSYPTSGQSKEEELNSAKNKLDIVFKLFNDSMSLFRKIQYLEPEDKEEFLKLEQELHEAGISHHDTDTPKKSV